MTSLPDWLVERAAVDEVSPPSRARLDRADPRELADAIAAVRDANARELATHPAAPAVAELEARVATETRRRADQRRRRRLSLLALATTAAAAVVLVTRFAVHAPGEVDRPGAAGSAQDEITRVKGAVRLVAYRLAGDQVERLEPDTLVRAGDLIQLRYNAGGHRYGVIASIDGAGVVTLHHPASEDAPPEATAVAPDTTTLPNAYALDDAPRFERFFFITANEPIDLQDSLAALRAFARRPDCATAALDLPAGLHQGSLRLRKPERPSSNHESP